MKRNSSSTTGATLPIPSIAFKGKVYDVTTSPLFIDGMHFEHYAGADLTDFIEDAPHGEEVMGEMTVVGEYKK